MEKVLVVDLRTDDREELLHARIDNGVQRAARDRGGLEAGHRRGNRHADGTVIRSDKGRGCCRLDLLGLVSGDCEGRVDVVRDVVAADAEDAGIDQMSVGPGCVGGGTAAQVNDEHAFAAVLLRQHGVGSARSGEVRLGDLELGGLGGSTRVVDSLGGAVNAERAEFEQVAVHALWGGDRVKLVQAVGDRVKLELRPLGRQVRLLRAGVDLGDVVLVDEAALELPLRVHQCGAHLRPGDREACVADRVAELLLELLKDGLDRVASLGHLYDLALAHSRRRYAS